MQFWILSYNRGEFLKNCVASIEYCAPQCGINIFDDNSTDQITRVILADLSVRHSVHYPPAADAVAGKHGGLYGNMQSALERVEQEDIICFVQDDMQLVRPISYDELQRIEKHFAEHSAIGFISPTFLKGCNRDKDADSPSNCITPMPLLFSLYPSPFQPLSGSMVSRTHGFSRSIV